MASVPTNISEKIFNISVWRGVNESPEGEAALKPGEASRMRNFRVTSGGALKKRPGSRNVAGLLSAYIAHVREGSEKLLMTDYGLGTGYQMYPRMAADEVGGVQPAGSPVEVTAENAGEHAGYYFKRGGATYALTRCVVTPASGTEAVTGGRATPGELTVIASGSENNGQFTGTRELETFSEAYVGGSGAGVRGERTARRAPTGTEPGWSTQNEGGYILRDGVLYRYYGVRVDSYKPAYKWRKYKCTVSSYGYTFYTESGWTLSQNGTLNNGNPSLSGNAGYSFNSSNGVFSLTGQAKTISAGGGGTLYDGGGSSVTRYDVSHDSKAGPNVSVYAGYKKTAQGPYTGYNTTYSRGDYLGDVTVPDGEQPEQTAGYVYVTAFYDGGTRYTVMRLGQDYYCYARDDAAGAASYERTYSFHGYPLAVSPDRADWYGSETYTEPNTLTDTAVRGIWSGFVGGREVLCVACGGFLWELKEEDGVWTKIPAGETDTSRDVHMFGFDEKLYILNGRSYKVWDGERLADVEGYRPLVSVSVEPSGGGTLLEGVNRLTAGRRCWFSPDGEATVFQLPEKNIASVDWVRDLTQPVAAALEDGANVGAAVTEGNASWRPGRPSADDHADDLEAGGDEAFGRVAEDGDPYTVDLTAGTVIFESAPPKGVNTLEIAWSAGEDYRGQVCAMRFAEVYNGAQDTRVFIYGDGSNRAFYSGLDHNGRPRADYFPDLYEVAVGDANTPITAMIRHYNKLMAFKLDSAWSIGYDTITLTDGTVTAGFYVAPVNRSVGNCAYGQAQLVQNRPRTLDGRSVIEWKATGGSGITGDQRNAERVSQRVDSSIRKFDLARARTFYDKFAHEYFVIGEDGTAIVQNLDVDAWYVYTGLDVTCMINYRDELYYGTRDGFLRHFSDDYFSDNGAAIDAWWESGAMSFSEDCRRKYSAMVWIGIKPEDNGYLEVTAKTDRKSDFAVYSLSTVDAGAVPEMERIKLKAKKFTYYKLIMSSNTADSTVTVVSADMRVRGTGYVR